ncbi:MAG: hypothetical protein HYR72_09060 [Deltaproteobacteria bacterium]|nr:hypothetical protein [Deltaproteobacteria bacterium]MBI3388906.1 hypothetical protein [Deltaproteobacteria bacterium]
MARAASIDALAFVAEHGVVLESARGPVPNLAQAIAGEPIRGSWWGHPRGNAIHNATCAVRDSPDVLVCRLIGGKITYVHRRLWPALVRLASQFKPAQLAAIREQHTASGKHRVVTTTFPRWVTPEIRAAAARLSKEAARQLLGAAIS